MPFSIQSKPIRTVLRWQLIAALVCAALALIWAGRHGAVSALLGGLTSFVSSLVYGWMVSRAPAATAGGALRTMLRAEAAKIIVIVAQFWLILNAYKQVVPLALFMSFAVAVMVFALALIASEE